MPPAYVYLELQGRALNENEYTILANHTMDTEYENSYEFEDVELKDDYFYRVIETKIYPVDTSVSVGIVENSKTFNIAKDDGCYISNIDTAGNESDYMVTHSQDVILNSTNSTEEVTIKNKLAKTAEVSINIDWADYDEICYKHPEEFELRLVYREKDSSDDWVDDYLIQITLNEEQLNATDFHMTVHNLPATKLIYDYEADTYELVEIEYSVTGENVISAAGGGSSSPDLTNAYRYVVESEDGRILIKVYPFVNMPLTVKKVWNDGTGDNNVAMAGGYSADVTLYRSTYNTDTYDTEWTEVESQVLNKENNYTYTWRKLPCQDSDGNVINSYKIVEESYNGKTGTKYAAEYYYQEENEQINAYWESGYYEWIPYEYCLLGYEEIERIGDTAYIVNTPVTSVTAKKEWEIENQSVVLPSEVVVSLQYKNSDGNWDTYYGHGGNGSAVEKSLPIDNKWQLTYDAPAYEIEFYSDGKVTKGDEYYTWEEDTYSGAYNTTPYEFRFREKYIYDSGYLSASDTEVGNYRISYEYSTSDEGTTTTITNTSKNLITLSGTMAWNDSDNKYYTRPDDVELIVTETVDGTSSVNQQLAQKVKWVKNETPNEWTYTIAGLPVTRDGNTINYTVEVDTGLTRQRRELTFATGATYSLNSSQSSTSNNVTTTNFDFTLVTGNLLISKTVKDLPDGEAQEDYNFNFKVKVTGGSSVYYTGEYAVYSEDATADNIAGSTAIKTGTTTDGTIEIAGGQKFYLKGLPAGYTYMVEEVPVQGFAIDTIPKGTIEKGKIAEGEVVNRWDPTSNVPGKPNPDPKPDDPDPDKPKPDNPNSDSDTPTETSETSDGTVASNAVVNSSDLPTNATVASLGSKTGDSLAIYLWIILFGIGAAGAVVAGGRLKRGKDQVE